MPKFRVFVEGKNVKIRSKDGVARHGFFTARFLEAEDGSKAEVEAKRLILEELGGYMLNREGDEPVLVVEETLRLKTFGEQMVPGKGFTWFEEES